MGIIQSKWGKTPVKGTIYSDWFARNVPFFGGFQTSFLGA